MMAGPASPSLLTHEALMPARRRRSVLRVRSLHRNGPDYGVLTVVPNARFHGTPKIVVWNRTDDRGLFRQHHGRDPTDAELHGGLVLGEHALTISPVPDGVGEHHCI